MAAVLFAAEAGTIVLWGILNLRDIERTAVLELLFATACGALMYVVSKRGGRVEFESVVMENEIPEGQELVKKIGDFQFLLAKDN